MIPHSASFWMQYWPSSYYDQTMKARTLLSSRTRSPCFGSQMWWTRQERPSIAGCRYPNSNLTFCNALAEKCGQQMYLLPYLQKEVTIHDWTVMPLSSWSPKVGWQRKAQKSCPTDTFFLRRCDDDKTDGSDNKHTSASGISTICRLVRSYHPVATGSFVNAQGNNLYCQKAASSYSNLSSLY